MSELAITPIPRRYTTISVYGIKTTEFRSSLEADWAFTLDHLGIKWEYEPVEVTLPDGSGYVPDFHLPEIGTWLEVKGEGIARLEKARAYARTIACDCPTGACECQWPGGELVFVGRPSHRPSGTQMRYGAACWEAALGRQLFLADCCECGHTFWIQLSSPACRYCRALKPRLGHLELLQSVGEVEFRRADRIPETLLGKGRGP